MSFDSELYIHDLDRKAFKAMNAFPMLVKLREVYITNVDEKAARITYMSTAIRLSENQFPEVYRLLPPICEKLGIDVPELYYIKSKELNAFTGGSANPFICVTSRLVNELPSQMISGVLAHECGHIACKHVLYHSIAGMLMNGIEKSPLMLIPGVKRYLTPNLERALLFWDRCSELSADRAAALCDGGADNYIDVMLRINEYKGVNREEFLKQAVDLHEYINESKSNKLMELMLTAENTHPLLATRVFECYNWSQSERFSEILNGTFSLVDLKKSREQTDDCEVITADVKVDENGADLDTINARLAEVNASLDAYTVKADRTDYAVAVGCGILAGIFDGVFIGESSLEQADSWGNEKVKNIVMKTARGKGYDGDDKLDKAIEFLEDRFELPADKAMNDLGGASWHHLYDFSHHPTPVGLFCSILTQFTGNVYGTNKDGNFQITNLAEDTQGLGGSFKEKICKGTVDWAFHMVSDMAGSSGTVKDGGLGTGLPGPIVSLLRELSATPLFKKADENGRRELAAKAAKLFDGTAFKDNPSGLGIKTQKLDLRTEIGLQHQFGQQGLAIALYEGLVRAFYFIRQLITEIKSSNITNPLELGTLDWKKFSQFKNRTVDRMLTVASMTFSVADTADAAVHAALESGANWVLFAGKFVTRFNYVGAGRAAVAIFKEISYEHKETQLIHEKMILSEQKSAVFLAELQKFKEQLDEKVSNYLAEDISAFMAGFDDISEGLASNNSNLVIHGNITIQKVLGREPQFTNQQEFDELMSSEVPLKF